MDKEGEFIDEMVSDNEKTRQVSKNCQVRRVVGLMKINQWFL